MKFKISALALAVFAALLVALPFSTAGAADDPDVLKIVKVNGATSNGSSLFEGDTIDLDANFKESKKHKLSLWSDVSGSWAPVAGFTAKTASSSGNYVFTGYTVTKSQNVIVKIDGSEEGTNELAVTAQEVQIGVPGTDGLLTTASGYIVGDNVAPKANFASGTKKVSLWTNASGTWAPVSGQTNKSTNSSGDYTFAYAVQGTEQLQVRTSTGLLTDIVTLAPVTPSIQLSAFTYSSSSRKATATATVLPAQSGRTVELQVQRRYTAETNETDAVNPDAKKGDRVGPWKTLVSAKQNSAGVATFSISNAYEANHKYRAVIGTSVTSNVVEFAEPLPTKNTGLAQVYFNTYEASKVDTRTRYFEGEFSMTAGAGCSAVAPIKYSTMKGRGNYSWSFKKKGYTLKIDSRSDLCGMGKNKKWALIANHYDKSLLRNQVAYNLGSKFDQLWTPKSKQVDFFMNGEYLGTYMLVERISISETGVTNKDDSNRLRIPELKSAGQATTASHPNNQAPNVTGGYVLEWDFRKGADKNVTVGSRGYVGIKDPEYDVDREGNRTDAGISAQQLDYINDYLDDADAALYGSGFAGANGWRKYIDEASAVDYYIAMEFLKPVDGNMWASVNMYKQRDGYNGQAGKLYFGPLWDFDLGLGSANRQGNVVSPTGFYLKDMVAPGASQSSKTWFNRLNEDSSFRAAVRARWKELYPTLSSSSFIDTQRDLIAASAAENFKKWSYSERISSVQVFKGSWSKDVAYVKSWMSDRRSWLNGQWG